MKNNKKFFIFMSVFGIIFLLSIMDRDDRTPKQILYDNRGEMMDSLNKQFDGYADQFLVCQRECDLTIQVPDSASYLHCLLQMGAIHQLEKENLALRDSIAKTRWPVLTRIDKALSTIKE